MIVKQAAVCGFCQGVRASVALAEKMLAEKGDKNCYSAGPIVHNRDLVKELEQKGLKVIKSPDEAEGGLVLVRAHGLPREDIETYKKRGFTLVDGTCPIVSRSQRLAASAEGAVLMFGVKKHAEVVAVLSRIKGMAYVISDVEDIDLIDASLSYTGIVQTTFSTLKFALIKDELKKRGVEVNYVNNICSASISRREAVKVLAGEVGGIVVVGDQGSSNTLELYKTALEYGKAWLIPSAKDVKAEMKECGVIGLTAGASVSDKTINEVRRRLEEL